MLRCVSFCLGRDLRLKVELQVWVSGSGGKGYCGVVSGAKRGGDVYEAGAGMGGGC